jgi:branched-chain amino acid transport system permease protein
VMYAPRGLTGLLMMHGPAVSTGRIGILAAPYALAALPLMALLIGTVLLFEMGHTANGSVVGETMAHVFGLTLDVTTAAPWIAAIVLTVGGAYGLMRLSPWLRESFSRATGAIGGAP